MRLLWTVPWYFDFTTFHLNNEVHNHFQFISAHYTPSSMITDTTVKSAKQVGYLQYRPGQPNWEYTIQKSRDFTATHILCEINFGHFEAPKNCHFDHLSNYDSWLFGSFWHFQFLKNKIQSLQNCYNGSFWSSEIRQNWFHVKYQVKIPN